MPICRLWNDNVHPYSDEKKGIAIAAKQSIEMDYEEAKDYLKKYSPVVLDGNNLPDPRYFKMLRIEKLQSVTAPAPQFISQMTGEKFNSQEELDAHLDKYLDALHDSDEKQKRIAKRGKQQREQPEPPAAA